MTWQPTTVTTIDGRVVKSDSETWRSVCEAVYTLGKNEIDRSAWLVSVAAKRGAAGRQQLEDEMFRIEPAYLLAMGTKEQRQAYLAQVERYRGEHIRKDLERRLIALWEQRKAAQAVPA